MHVNIWNNSLDLKWIKINGDIEALAVKYVTIRCYVPSKLKLKIIIIENKFDFSYFKSV